MVNEINPGLGADAPFQLIVEGFFDADYNDIDTVPEPSSLVLMGTGLLWLVRRRSRSGIQSPL